MFEKKLSSMEYKFMQFIWKHPDGAYSYEIYENFPQALGTKSAVMSHIKDKGYVKMIQKGKQTIYIPLIEKKDYDKAVMEQMLKEKLKVNSLDALIAALCGKSKLTEAQKEKLENLIEELREDDE